MNLGVIGVGGVGGYFGGKLVQLLKQVHHKDLKVYFIARGEHLKEIKTNGLILSTVDEGEFICNPTFAADNFNELPVLDLCLICVKSFYLDNVLRGLKGKIKSDTDIIPLLNGVDVYERIRDIIPQRIFELFDSAKIKYKWCADPYVEIWSKYIFIAAYGMVTASENKTLGQILESKELSNMVIDIMNEIVEVAKKQGINLPANVVQESVAKGKNFPFATKTSFQRDFELKHKPNERELFGVIPS